MTLTIFGVLTILISLWLMFRGSVLQQFAFVILLSLLGGASAIDLPALGGSSIRPVFLGFLLLFGRIVLTRMGGLSAILRALRKNWALVAFCAYGVVGAMILPRVFAGSVDVVSMKPVKLRSDIIQQYPLAFSSQNVTAAFYLSGTLLAVIVGDIVARRQEAHRTLVKAVVVTSWLHIGFGLLGVVLKMFHHEDWLHVFRNASYAQLDHEYRGYIRITGIMPEASVYASFAFQQMIFTTELWLRDVSRRATGLTSLALLIILVLSSSSSAYVGLAGYAVVLSLRWIVFPKALSVRKAAIVLGLGIAAVCVILLMAAVYPAVSMQLQDMLEHMTVDKANSRSAHERGIWARQGIDAFVASYGLGVGAGSFRSSSNILAIMGSLGVIGLVTFIWYVVQILQPWRDSTFQRSTSEVQAVGVATCWTIIVSLIPALVNAPGPDPGLTFALYAAMSMVWRDGRQRAPAGARASTSRGLSDPAEAAS